MSEQEDLGFQADPGLQAVILAGGLGTRLRPLTEKCPKPLVDVAGRPYLEWQLLDLKRQGISRVLLLVAYLGEMIQAHFGDGSRLGMRVSYSFERAPMGTGGALALARDQLDPTFALLNGDSFVRAPLAQMAAAFARDGQARALMATYDFNEAVPVIANVKLSSPDPASGRLARVEAYEKDAGDAKGFRFVDAGAYIMSRGVLDQAPGGKHQLESLWPALIARDELTAWPSSERFYDIGDRDRLTAFEEKIRDYFPDAFSR